MQQEEIIVNDLRSFAENHKVFFGTEFVEDRKLVDPYFQETPIYLHSIELAAQKLKLKNHRVVLGYFDCEDIVIGGSFFDAVTYNPATFYLTSDCFSSDGRFSPEGELHLKRISNYLKMIDEDLNDNTTALGTQVFISLFDELADCTYCPDITTAAWGLREAIQGYLDIQGKYIPGSKLVENLFIERYFEFREAMADLLDFAKRRHAVCLT